MDKPIELSLEQQFSIRSFETQVEKNESRTSAELFNSTLQINDDARSYLQASPQASMGFRA